MQQKLFKRPLLFAIISVWATGVAFSQTTSKTGNNCGCDYMNWCNYTALYTYKGQKYYGINRSEKDGDYYRCANGLVTKLHVYQVTVFAGNTEDYNPFTNTTTITRHYEDEDRYKLTTILKYGAPVGASWTSPGSDWQFRIAETLPSYVYEGRAYKNVIKVRTVIGYNASYLQHLKTRKENVRTAYYMGQRITQAVDHYWAKNVGYLHQQESWEAIEAEEEKRLTPAEKNKRKNDENVFYGNASPEQKKQIPGNQKNNAAFTGNADNALEGYWSYYEYCNPYLSFELNKNGTFKYYVGRSEKKAGRWKVSTDTLLLAWSFDGQEKLEKYAFKRLNNAYTGNPSLVLDWVTDEKREFEIVGGKMPWAGLPAYGQSATSQKQALGVIDKELVGSWIFRDSKGFQSTYTLTNDGKGTRIYYTNSVGQEESFEWRVMHDRYDFLVFLNSRNDGAPCHGNKIRITKVKEGSSVTAIEINRDKFIRSDKYKQPGFLELINELNKRKQ